MSWRSLRTLEDLVSLSYWVFRRVPLAVLDQCLHHRHPEDTGRVRPVAPASLKRTPRYLKDSINRSPGATRRTLPSEAHGPLSLPRRPVVLRGNPGLRSGGGIRDAAVRVQPGR